MPPFFIFVILTFIFVTKGSHQECQYRLFTMGISVDTIPVSLSGSLIRDDHKRWLSFRVSKEAHLVEDDEMDVDN